jgi:hypothetical protein
VSENRRKNSFQSSKAPAIRQGLFALFGVEFHREKRAKIALKNRKKGVQNKAKIASKMHPKYPVLHPKMRFQM